MKHGGVWCIRRKDKWHKTDTTTGWWRSTCSKRVFHSIHPCDKLQTVWSKNRPKLQSLKRGRVIFDSQWEKLFPPLGDPPDSDAFDTSLLHLLIREICHLKAPVYGWHKMPADDDDSVEPTLPESNASVRSYATVLLLALPTMNLKRNGSNSLLAWRHLGCTPTDIGLSGWRAIL